MNYTLVYILGGLVVSYLILKVFNADHKFCITSVLNNELRCRPICTHGQFSLYGMKSCLPWLTCSDISADIKFHEEIENGAVKEVKKGTWKMYDIAINSLKTPQYKEDFYEGLKNLISFQPELDVVQLVGYCEKSDTFITEYHQFKSADNLEHILNKNKYKNSAKHRFKICLNYIKIIKYLHSQSNGSRVMCDSNHPKKALSQFLVRDDLSIVLNDVDALPVADRQSNKLVKCGHKELSGEFVAPEQLWPFSDKDFDDKMLRGYDEKTDIWKIPDVCKTLLNDSPGSAGILLKLFGVNSKCRADNPSQRPSAEQVLDQYLEVYENFFGMDNDW